MGGENGRRLTTNANVADDLGETYRNPSSLVNSEASSSNSTELEESTRNSRSHVPVEASFRLECSAIDSPESTKHSSGISYKLTDSPTIQVMERTKSPDPNNSSARTDSPNRWSDDSNDSLFSIRMGNDSFSNDVSMRLSGEMCTTGELSLSESYLPQASHMSEELYQSEESHKSPAAKGIENAVKDANVVLNKPNSDVQRESNLSGSIDPNTSHHDDSKARNEALASALTKGHACPLCGCSWCGKMKCCSCCRWPRFDWFCWPKCCSKNCLIWPSCCSFCSKCYCSNSICSSCYSWRRETKRNRSNSANSLMEEDVTSNSKHKAEP